MKLAVLGLKCWHKINYVWHRFIAREGKSTTLPIFPPLHGRHLLKQDECLLETNNRRPKNAPNYSTKSHIYILGCDKLPVPEHVVVPLVRETPGHLPRLPFPSIFRGIWSLCHFVISNSFHITGTFQPLLAHFFLNLSFTPTSTLSGPILLLTPTILIQLFSQTCTFSVVSRLVPSSPSHTCMPGWHTRWAHFLYIYEIFVYLQPTLRLSSKRLSLL